MIGDDECNSSGCWFWLSADSEDAEELEIMLCLLIFPLYTFPNAPDPSKLDLSDWKDFTEKVDTLNLSRNTFTKYL